MGNARSSTRRSIHAFSMQHGDEDGTCVAMYKEPLLDQPSTQRSTQVRSWREKMSAIVDVAAAAATASSSSSSPRGTHAEVVVDLPALIHQLNSFFAVLWPVCITMILASFAACFAADEDVTRAMTTYMYYQNIDSSDKSVGEKSMLAFFNALFVIGFIACLTFAIVLLYKFNFTKVFFGYCVLYSASLLGLAGSKMVVLVLGEKLHCIFDSLSLTVAMYNFAVVGVLSIFYQKGIPRVVEQGYLVTISVIVAWQLSQLPEWSIWMILLLLGFWDLFAVLTPMGPLRCLVDLIQEKGTPLPGLLFQAEVTDAHRSSSSSAQPGTSVLVLESQRPAPLTPSPPMPTRSTVPEVEFMSQILTDDNPASVTWEHALLPPLEAHVLGFQHQVQVFLEDHHSSFLHRAYDIGRRYMDRQPELWRRFYIYYGVQFVSPAKPYPAVYQVFTAAPPTPAVMSRPGRANTQVQDNDTIGEDTSIRLGLGDFIFYSVLVARAAMHGFAAFVACFLFIIIGLAITMFLLAKYDALPALPISIFTGIAAFLLTLELLEPFLQELLRFAILSL